MVAELITDKRDISQLRGAYNAAFAQLAREVGVWQELRGRNPHPSAVEEARHRVRQAEAAGIVEGRVLRSLNPGRGTMGSSLSPQAVFAVVAAYGRRLELRIQPHDLRRTCAKLCRAGGGELEQIQLLLGHASIQTTERYLGVKQDLVHAPNDRIGVRWHG